MVSGARSGNLVASSILIVSCNRVPAFVLFVAAQLTGAAGPLRRRPIDWTEAERGAVAPSVVLFALARATPRIT